MVWCSSQFVVIGYGDFSTRGTENAEGPEVALLMMFGSSF